MAQRNDLETLVTIAAAIIFGPVVVVIMVGTLLDRLAPIFPVIGIAALIGAAAYAYHRYDTSPFTIRRRHEQDVLDLLARAERQQHALPTTIDVDLILTPLRRHTVLADPQLLEEWARPAQAIYAEEFRSLLPPMPPVPLVPERVYDVDYDRRTLKKGEEPPHRERRDGKGRPTTRELEDFKKFLFCYVTSTTDPDATVALFLETYAEFAGVILSQTPAPSTSSLTLTVPIVDLLPGAGTVIGDALGVLWCSKVKNKHHFSSVRNAVGRNRTDASERLLRQKEIDAGKVIDPGQHPGSDREVLDAYLGGTPLHPLLLAPVPFAVPTAKRFEGHWIVARQGSGKTNALECLIDADLAEVAAGRASLVVIDSQGTTRETLLGRLSTLKLFAPGEPLAGRLIYLEPDLDFPLALNIFDIGVGDIGRLSASEREDIVASACEVIEFLFTGLLGGELSDNMTMLYKYLVPAMLAIPGADMTTFIELLDSDARSPRSLPAGYLKYRPYFAGLDPEILSFLETDYVSDFELKKTKAAVRRRLRAAMADTTFRRMFTQPRNKLDLFAELQAGKVILVNTYAARSYVEQFGRLVLALIMQATRQRLDIDPRHRLPTFVYVDECQDYIAGEERIARYVDKCRKQHVALVFANQRLSNIENPKVRNALSNMAIKFAGASDADDAELASLAMTTADHIRHLPRGTFAAYVSGLTPHGIDLTFPLSPLESAPRMSRAEWETMRQEMRQRYAADHRTAETCRRRDDPPDVSSSGASREEAGPLIEGTVRQVRIAPPSRDPGDDYDPLQ